jgi:hypothetical protein
MVLLGLLVKARTITRERIASIPLEQGDSAVKQALKLQGQMQGIDLAIDAIFDICNFELEEQTHDNAEQPSSDAGAGLNGDNPGGV